MYLKISRFLEKWSFKFRQKALYYTFKSYIKNNENYFMHVYRHNRGIGKSYTLLQLAHKYKCPIFVSKTRDIEYLDRLNRDYFKNKCLEIIVARNDCRGMRFDLALCEEGIEDRLIHEIILPMCKRIIGYTRIDY
ncbi:hypothetical protein [Clostridium sp.]|uniref:hypothetical protein n=1 Tax=Clostridium sp. TaxID=1506 RepID=UPI001A5CF678|nr:hypothetical protein [Clostridium sp.]MBK5239872.1 hypothetical protein [Clostridium sp.]